MPYNEGKYVCSLSPELQEKALKELNEDPARREEAIAILREWVIKQPHINSRTEDAFLLRFLRHSKFSIEKAKQRIDHFYTMKTAIPEWFSKCDPNDPKLQKLIKSGMTLPLGYNKEGRRVFLNRIGANDPSQAKIEDIMKVNYMIGEWMLWDEQTQISGAELINDMSGMSGSHMAQWTPMTTKKAMAYWQDSMPLRMKGLHYFRPGALFEKIFQLFKVFMKEKILQRVHMHGSNLESLQQAVPVDILPKEYGGQGGSANTIAENLLKDLMANRQYFLDDDKYNVDESKRPGKPKTQEDLFGMDGTFRKLNID